MTDLPPPVPVPTQNGTTTSWSDTQKLLAFIVVVAFIFVIYFWMFHPPTADPATTGVLNTLVGTLGGFAGMVITFYFGSSRGERNKDAASAAQGSTTTTTTTPPTTQAPTAG